MNLLKLNAYGLGAIVFFTLAIVNAGQAIIYGPHGEVGFECLRLAFISLSWWTGSLLWRACQLASNALQVEDMKSMSEQMAHSLREAFRKAAQESGEDEDEEGESWKSGGNSWD